MSQRFAEGQRVKPSPAGLSSMPSLPGGHVARVIDEHTLLVQVDGRDRPQQYGAHVWEPES